MKLNSKKIASIVTFILALSMLISICSFAAAEPIKLVMASSGRGPGDPITDSGQAWKEAIEEQSNGEIIVEYFGRSELGGERDMLEGVQLGTIDLFQISTGVASNLAPELDLFSLPFLFLNREQCEEVEFGPIGKEIVAYVDKVEGLKGLMIGGAGWRMPMNRVRPIESLEDFKDLKMRVMEVPMMVDAYKALDARPVPMAFPELYLALKLGTVDGQENSPAISYAGSMHEVANYYTTLPIFVDLSIFLVNDKLWESLSPEHQKIISDTVIIGVETMNQVFEDEDKKALVAMEEAGVEVYRMPISEMAPFVEATNVIWEEALPKFPKRIQELALEIKDIGEKYK